MVAECSYLVKDVLVSKRQIAHCIVFQWLEKRVKLGVSFVQKLVEFVLQFGFDSLIDGSILFIVDKSE